MKVRDVMTADPACCTPETDLQEVARKMKEQDCGAIPVVENDDEKRPVGVITDRDIVCRIVAEGLNPLLSTAKDCMTPSAVSVEDEARVRECAELMEEKQVRRVVVVDEDDCCCGMVSQADLAEKASDSMVAEVLREVSKPNETSSRV